MKCMQDQGKLNKRALSLWLAAKCVPAYAKIMIVSGEAMVMQTLCNVKSKN